MIRALTYMAACAAIAFALAMVAMLPGARAQRILECAHGGAAQLAVAISSIWNDLAPTHIHRYLVNPSRKEPDQMKVNGMKNMSGAYTTASQGKKPNITGTNPKASAGRNTGLNGSTGGSKSPVMSGGGKKAGNHAMLRKSY